MMSDERTDLLLSHLRSRRHETGLPPSLAPVARGDLSAIPADLCWDNSVYLAHLINGYELAPAAGLGDCGRFVNGRHDLAETGRWVGDLLELWVCLYFEHRRWRHFGFEAEGASLVILVD